MVFLSPQTLERPFKLHMEKYGLVARIDRRIAVRSGKIVLSGTPRNERDSCSQMKVAVSRSVPMDAALEMSSSSGANDRC